MIDRRAAFRAQRADVLAFCESLAPADWRMNSRASGWSIADVVAHMGSACHAMFTRQAAKLMRGDDIEAVNDELVAARRDRTPTEVFTEYRRWSRVFGAVVPTMVQTPLGRLEMPLAELGRFPARLLPSALVFDHHTHLRYDMAPALGRSVGDIDANRMAAVLEWMTAVLANQLTAAAPAWLDRPLALTLAGPGGGSWRVDTTGAVTPGRTEPAAAHITAVAAEFPEWGTTRANWRERDVTIAGDEDYGAVFLDAVDIV
ncbi:MAG: maleylpyruvate isomerase N-terminal domain-containing protein [Mycobacterium sp.]